MSAVFEVSVQPAPAYLRGATALALQTAGKSYGPTGQSVETKCGMAEQSQGIGKTMYMTAGDPESVCNKAHTTLRKAMLGSQQKASHSYT